MVAQISLSVCTSPMAARVAPAEQAAKENGRPAEAMPPPERAMEGCSWSALGTLVYAAYGASAAAYFAVRCIYTLDLGALRWRARAAPCARLTETARSSGEQQIGQLPALARSEAAQQARGQ